MKRKILCKCNIKWLVLLLIVVIYIVAYVYRYNDVVKPDIRYYEKGTVIEWGGLEYTVDGNVYNSEEFLEQFNLEEYEVSALKSEGEIMFIVASMEVKKLSEDYDEELNGNSYMDIYSKYWQSGKYMDIEGVLNAESTNIEELKAGEKTTLYKVFTITDLHHNKKVWNNVKNEEVWFEFTDNEKYQYVTRVKILN